MQGDDSAEAASGDSSAFWINVPAIDRGDSDSAFDNVSLSGSTVASLRVYDFRFEHGRRYHALHSDAEYHLPNDEAELHRLYLQHQLFRMTINGALYKSPLPEDVHHVLDIGTGSGIWAVDFAEEHPSAKVVGTDISPVIPTYQPLNCSFYVEDVEQDDWNFDHDFDFIHARTMSLALKNWSNFFRVAYSHLKPGAWLELQDFASPMLRCDDGTALPDSPLFVWAETMRRATSQMGVDLAVADQFEHNMRSCGFVDIQVHLDVWPLGSWSKTEQMIERGGLAAEHLLNGLEGFSMSFFTKALGWSEAQVRALVNQAAAQIQDRSSHAVMAVIFVYGRKPLAS